MSSPSSIAANVLGTAGAICWSIQLLPQIHQNHRRQHTHGLQPTMMLLWATAGIPLGVYNIVREFPVALQVQPQILTFLSLVTWAQTKYCPPARDVKERSVGWCMAVLAVACVIAGGVEAGVIFALRSATRSRTEAQVEFYWPVVLMGAFSAFLLCAGVGRHYVDIYKERTVRGISFIFVGLDALGDLTSLTSVVFWWKAGRELDVLGLVVYGSELILWLGVFACGGWYNLRPWIRTKVRQSRSQRCVQGSTDEAEVEQGDADSDQASMTSATSYASGSAFRTASGTVVPVVTETQGANGQDLGRDALRLRSIVQV